MDSILNQINWHQAVVLICQATLVAGLILVLFRLRTYFGLVPLYVTIGVFQYIQVVLAHALYVEMYPGILFSPGSIVLFTAGFFAVILIYLEEDATEARKLCYALFGANVALSALVYLFSISLSGPGVLNVFDLPREFFVDSARVMLVGTVALVIDIVLVIALYERISRRTGTSVFLRAAISLVVVFVVDSLVFATGSFVDSPRYTGILLSGILGKSVMALFYAVVLDLYFRWSKKRESGRQKKPGASEMDDVFHFLTFRQKYEKMKELNLEVEASRQSLREVNETLDERVRLRTRELEEAQEELFRKQKLATIGQLAGSFAHEIRTPLAVVTNHLYYLQEAKDADAEKVEECYREIANAVESASDIVNEVLDYAGTSRANTSDFSLIKAIESAEHAIPDHIEFRNTLSVEDVICRGDSNQIARILSNLFKNAAEEMPDGGQITVKGWRSDDMAVVVVSDNGPGIPSGKEESIFEPLVSGKVNGIGLGLALSRRYAELNGGALVVCQTDGEHGAAFKLTVPVAKNEHS